MRVVLNEKDIFQAIEDFILDTVNVPDDVRIDIDLKATRGEAGYTAEIDLVHLTTPVGKQDNSVNDSITAKDDAREEGLGIVDKIDAARAEAKAPRRRGRPPGSKNLPKSVVGKTTAEQLAEAGVQPDAIPEAEPAEEAPTAPQDEVIAAHPAHETKAETIQPNEVPEVIQEMPAEAPVVDETPEEEPEPDYTPTPETPGFTTDDAEAPAEATPTPTRSLFAGLSKPTN